MGLVNIKCLNYFVYILSFSSILKDDNFNSNFLLIYCHLVKDYIDEKIDFPFLVKFVAVFPFTERGGIVGIFLSMQHDLIIDQSVLELVFGIFSFNDKSFFLIFFFLILCHF